MRKPKTGEQTIIIMKFMSPKKALLILLILAAVMAMVFSGIYFKQAADKRKIEADNQAEQIKAGQGKAVNQTSGQESNGLINKQIEELNKLRQQTGGKTEKALTPEEQLEQLRELQKLRR